MIQFAVPSLLYVDHTTGETKVLIPEQRFRLFPVVTSEQPAKRAVNSIEFFNHVTA